jgi:tetratricopeptide (TPR) repeat protein
MLPAISGRRALLVVMAVFVAVVMATPGFAQSTGMLKGKIVDGKGEPVVGAKITMTDTGNGISKTTKSDKKGEYFQVGLAPGSYKVTAEKEGLGVQSFDVRVRLGDPTECNFQLVAGRSGPTKEDQAKATQVRKLFDDGVAASRSNDHDGAIAKFNEALLILPACYDCYYNIGFAQAQKKEYDAAEASFKKALELKADYVEAYNGLATVYNAQKKFDLAQQASQKAAELAATAPAGAGGGGGVDALYNQGVIAWNAGQADAAKAKFEEALKINPNHADSHYQLGMCYINLGKMTEAVTEFEAYLNLAPDGQFAATAKAMVAQLKK